MFKLTIRSVGDDIWARPAEDATIVHKHKGEVNVAIEAEDHQKVIWLVKNFMRRIKHDFNCPGLIRLVDRVLSLPDDDFINIPHLDMSEGSCRIEVKRITQQFFHYTLKG